jgi:pSer/pThr/pTyr-binding forkhead associated (FHA) protein
MLVGWASRVAARVEAAWAAPRVERLALPASDGVVVFGRARDCDCVLADSTVSRSHAAIRRDGERWFLRDLASANGTRLNGRRVVDEVEVRPGDRVGFGAVGYRLTAPG